MKTKVTIIVVGHNSWHYLQKNFASLEFLREIPEVEVLYIDNASTDETRAAMAYSYPHIKTISCGVNRGVSAARNIGIVNSTSEYILFLDSDAELTKEAYFEMLRYMEENQSVGLCGCKLIGQDGLPQASCKHFPTKWGVFKSGMHNLCARFGWNIFPNAYSQTIYDTSGSEPMVVDFVIGACQFVRRKAQVKVGFFDEEFFYGPEDADFCRRMHNADYSVVYLPYISLPHSYQRTVGQKFFSKLTFMQLKGFAHYFKKVLREKIKHN